VFVCIVGPIYYGLPYTWNECGIIISVVKGLTSKQFTALALSWTDCFFCFFFANTSRCQTNAIYRTTDGIVLTLNKQHCILTSTSQLLLQRQTTHLYRSLVPPPPPPRHEHQPHS
ncbi:unnamed protein product, partial [Laminaria digitata]